MTEKKPPDDVGPESESNKVNSAELRRARLSNDELADEVQRIIDEAIRRNLPHEIGIVVILISVAAVGIYLLVSGAVDRRWELLASGSSCAVAVAWPVSQLFGMWKFNLALKTLPTLIRTADAKNRQILLFRIVERLIDKL